MWFRRLATQERSTGSPHLRSGTSPPVLTELEITSEGNPGTCLNDCHAAGAYADSLLVSSRLGWALPLRSVYHRRAASTAMAAVSTSMTLAKRHINFT